MELPGVGQVALMSCPGRLCLFGEHSDWAGSYRSKNVELAVGRCIVAATNQVIEARVRKNPTHLYLCTGNQSSTSAEVIFSDFGAMDSIASEGGYWSYAAGVACEMSSRFPKLGGLSLCSVESSLPLKKGLSSSAAICVLVARAFDTFYSLDLSTAEIMDIAYAGELRTPSRCGRMDQCCAFGPGVSMMTFDGDTQPSCSLVHLREDRPIHMVIVDLCAAKDTKRILGDLHKAYPYPKNDSDRLFHALMDENLRISDSAIEALRDGNAEALGALMKEWQELFDTAAMPLCQELQSPVLHELLGNAEIQRLTWGGKGVGSQGDGSAQLVAKGRAEQSKLLQLVSAMGMKGLPLTLVNGSDLAVSK